MYILILKYYYDIWYLHIFLPIISLNVSVHSLYTRSNSGSSFSIGPKRSLHAFLFKFLRSLDVKPFKIGADVSYTTFLLKHR